MEDIEHIPKIAPQLPYALRIEQKNKGVAVLMRLANNSCRLSCGIKGDLGIHQIQRPHLSKRGSAGPGHEVIARNYLMSKLQSFSLLLIFFFQAQHLVKNSLKTKKYCLELIH
jgi:hypothetical protein